MNETKITPRDPLQGTQVMSTVATGGAGGIFQARVGALYLANMLTGLPTAFCLHGARVEELRFEARYQSVHTDDVYCRLTDAKGTWLQLIQCKRGLNATAGNTDFIDGLQGAWRDFLGIGGSPFDRACDLLVLATITSASAAIRDVTLRQATLDVLDRLVDAGSSLAFQLRDYLATSSPGIPSKLLVSSSAAQPIK